MFEGGGTILDIGANNGISSAYFHKIRPDWKITAFEPNVLHRNSLERLKKKNKNFEYHLIGLSEKKGEMTFYTPTYFGIPLHCETSTQKQPMEHFRDDYYGFVADKIRYKEHRAPVKTLDELGLHPDVIKIDSEGEDLNILKGGVETLKQCRPFILLEGGPEIYTSLDEFCRDLAMEVFFFDIKQNVLIQSEKSLTKDENHGRNLVVIPHEKLDKIDLPQIRVDRPGKYSG